LVSLPLPFNVLAMFGFIVLVGIIGYLADRLQR